jgi:hypothetical protein
MKKNYFKWSAYTLAAGLMLSSCISELESPLVEESASRQEAISEETSSGENLRKAPQSLPYQEKFTNQNFQDPSKPYAFPGSGLGNATHLGKGYSFFNQYALGAPDANGVVFTTAAPVTEFFKNELIGLGLDPDLLDSNYKTVSSVTVDEKGNSIWFFNISNKAQFDQFGNISFVAEVEIVGGTGKFKGAKGTATVVGNVGTNGKGSTLVKGTIIY